MPVSSGQTVLSQARPVLLQLVPCSVRAGCCSWFQRSPSNCGKVRTVSHIQNMVFAKYFRTHTLRARCSISQTNRKDWELCPTLGQGVPHGTDQTSLTTTTNVSRLNLSICHLILLSFFVRQIFFYNYFSTLLKIYVFWYAVWYLFLKLCLVFVMAQHFPTH